MKIIKFIQEDCNPCKTLSQMLPAMGRQVDEEIMITDENRDEVKAKYDIMSTPTMIALDGDKEVARVSGANFGAINDFYSNIG